MSWKWEYAFGAEATTRTAPAPLLREVQKKADELVRMCEVTYLHARDRQGLDPKGRTLTIPGGMITYQGIVRWRPLVGRILTAAGHSALPDASAFLIGSRGGQGLALVEPRWLLLHLP
ncbi:hypothetical protein [Streptomyces sp. NPDC054901]